MTTPADLARSYIAMWNAADVGAVDRIVAADVVGHVNGATLHGRETLRQRIAALRGMYADAAFSADDVIVERDRAVVRWMFRGTNTGPAFGKPATQKVITITGINIFRIENGQIAELWVSADDLGELEQLGAR